MAAKKKSTQASTAAGVVAIPNKLLKPPTVDRVIEAAVGHLSEHMSSYFVVGYDAMDREMVFCNINSSKDHAACVFLLEKLLYQLTSDDMN
jgi:hypothetical protein